MGAPMRNRTARAATICLYLVCLGVGCGRKIAAPAVSVPADCQAFLEKYFTAVASKDVETIQDLSSYVRLAVRRALPEASVEVMRLESRRSAAKNFRWMIEEFGEVEDYTVIRAKVTAITPADLEAADMQGADSLAGIHAEILCRVKASKKDSAAISLTLFKETEDSEYWIEAYSYQAEP